MLRQCRQWSARAFLQREQLNLLYKCLECQRPHTLRARPRSPGHYTARPVEEGPLSEREAKGGEWPRSSGSERWGRGGGGGGEAGGRAGGGHWG